MSASSPPVNAAADNSPLTPTMNDVMGQCSRFRVLVVGRSGAGKSSLINTLFKCTTANVSDVMPGRSAIEDEIASEHNKRFVLHDSQGYEPGEMQNFKILEQFIEKRSVEKNESERLHAIWLCISTPFAGGRVFERGEERLFKIKHGNVPIMVVFTKFDELVAMVRMDMIHKEIRLDHSEFNKKLYEDADRIYDENCIKPLRKVLKHNIPPPQRVSSQPGYEDTLARLVQATLEQMNSNTRGAGKKRDSLLNLFRPKSSPSSTQHTTTNSESELHPSEVMLATAQGVNTEAKIRASIDVGRKKYWRGLASSANFFGKTLNACLAALHTDIVVVWNLPGLGDYLESDQFKENFLKTIVDLFDKDRTDPSHNFDTSKISATIGAGTSLLTTMVGSPEGLIVAPIVIGAFVLKWLYDIYQKTEPTNIIFRPETLRCLMAYIVDLTVVMHTLFQRSRLSGSSALSPETADSVVDEYNGSSTRRNIHFKVRRFVEDNGALQAFNKDLVFDEVVSLIDMFTKSEPADQDTVGDTA